MESIWKGKFLPLRKHVVSVSFVEDEDMRAEDYPDPDSANEYGYQKGEETRYEEWSDGFFRVSFDGDGHGSGVYFYPATVEEANSARFGFLPPAENFYRF